MEPKAPKMKPKAAKVEPKLSQRYQNDAKRESYKLIFKCSKRSVRGRQPYFELLGLERPFGGILWRMKNGNQIRDTSSSNLDAKTGIEKEQEQYQKS